MFGRVMDHIHTITYQAMPGGQPADWVFTEVTVPGYWTDSGVFIQAITGDSTAPPLAIDDVTLNSGACA
jgi:hypothetical protein